MNTSILPTRKNFPSSREEENYARKTAITSTSWEFDNTREDEYHEARRKRYEDAIKTWPTKPIWTGEEITPYPSLPNPYSPSYPSVPVYPYPHTPEDVFPQPDIYPPDTYPYPGTYPNPSDFIPKPKTPLTREEIEDMLRDKNQDIIDAKDALIKKLQRDLEKQKKANAKEKEESAPKTPITPSEDFI